MMIKKRDNKVMWELVTMKLRHSAQRRKKNWRRRSAPRSSAPRRRHSAPTSGHSAPTSRRPGAGRGGSEDPEQHTGGFDV